MPRPAGTIGRSDPIGNANHLAGADRPVARLGHTVRFNSNRDLHRPIWYCNAASVYIDRPVASDRAATSIQDRNRRTVLSIKLGLITVVCIVKVSCKVEIQIGRRCVYIRDRAVHA